MPNVSSLVVLDNFDSFTYNLVDEFATRGIAVAVFRNDASLEEMAARALRADLLVVSPGPGTPETAGSCLALVRLALGRVPIFGVCLGHQALVVAAGGAVGPAPRPVHGKATPVHHRGDLPFEGLASPFVAGRYHSLAASAVPPDLMVTATGDDAVMAVSHRSAAAIGVQFHPESILTPQGGLLIDNVLAWAGRARR